MYRSVDTVGTRHRLVRPGFLHGARALHHYTTRRVEAATDFVLDDGAKRGREMLGRNDAESQSGVKRHVPRHVTEGCQRNRGVAVAAGPLTHARDQFRSQAPAAVFRIDVDLLEM